MYWLIFCIILYDYVLCTSQNKILFWSSLVSSVVCVRACVRARACACVCVRFCYDIFFLFLMACFSYLVFAIWSLGIQFHFFNHSVFIFFIYILITIDFLFILEWYKKNNIMLATNSFLCPHRMGAYSVALVRPSVRTYVRTYVRPSVRTYVRPSVRLSVRSDILWTQLLLNRMADFA
jgi:hypothetical protein